MNKSNLITVSPKIREKGFKNENISLRNNAQEDLNYAFSKIEKLYNKIKDNNILNKNEKIIKKIYNSYLKIQNDQNLDDSDLILKKHENVELKKISEKNLERYFVYRYKFNIYPKIKKIDNYPPCVQIEPTSICNYRCIMCYQADKSFSNKSNGFMGHMSFDIFKKSIDELEGNVEAITFASRGEPTLNKDFSKMIKYCESKFLALKLNTNASMLNEKLIHEILSSDLQTIVFSIDAKDKESYEKIRVNGKFDKVLKNLELFNNIRSTQYDRSSKVVRISGVKINEKQDIEEMKKQWGNIADIIAFTNYVPWESSYENSLNEIKSPCTELWSRIFIWQDGKVNPCDYDYKSVLSKWNVNNATITEIWNSDYYNDLRQKHLNNERNKIDPCNRCINA